MPTPRPTRRRSLIVLAIARAWRRRRRLQKRTSRWHHVKDTPPARHGPGGTQPQGRTLSVGTRANIVRGRRTPVRSARVPLVAVRAYPADNAGRGGTWGRNTRCDPRAARTYARRRDQRRHTTAGRAIRPAYLRTGVRPAVRPLCGRRSDREPIPRRSGAVLEHGGGRGGGRRRTAAVSVPTPTRRWATGREAVGTAGGHQDTGQVGAGRDRPDA